MAEAIVGPLLSKLQQVAVNEAQALAAVGGEIDKLRDKLMWLQAFVHETDLRSRLDGSRLVRVLAWQTREAAFEAEDAIDLFYLKGSLSHRFGRNWRRAVLEFVLNIRTYIYVRFTLSSWIRSLNERLQEIVDNSTKYSSSEDGSSGKRCKACRAIPPMRHGWDEEYTKPFELYARPDEKEELAKKLKSKLGAAPVVIPVIGVGGVGKRALLRHAYESDEFKECFDVRIKVSFPRDVVETSMMVREQVETILSSECSRLKKQATMGEVCYLVVIESPVSTTTWSKLEPKFLEMHGKAGSKILVPVTSSPREDVQGSGGIKINDFTDEESKQFFGIVCDSNDLYQAEEKEVRTNKIRDDIKEITGGRPLAVVLLAKLMRTMPSSKWEAAAEYMKHSNEDSELQSVLSLCVDDLPDELKSCLFFTAGFPVGQEIDAQQLVRLWMAEGFLTHQHHGLETERLGQCYLRELIYRGLLQLVRKTSSAHGGHVERVAIHDQIHPLLISEAQRTSFMDIHYGGCIPAPANTRRLALHRYNHKFDALSNGLGKLRTVVSYSESVDPKDSSSKHEDKKKPEPTLKMRDLCQRSPYLRVINLEGIHVVDRRSWWARARRSASTAAADPTERVRESGGTARVATRAWPVSLPSCIRKMVHLQYLGLRSSNLEELPSSVGNLRQLQTIDVRGTKVRELPKRVWKIKALRHVLGDGLAFPRCTGDDDLKLMQTLDGVTIKAVAPAKTTTKKRGKNSASGGGGGLGSLQRLHVVEVEDEESQRVALATVLADLSSSINSLKLSGRATNATIPITNLFAGASVTVPCLQNVESLELDGKLTTEPQHASECCLINSRILNRLTRLVLRSTGIKQDFITRAISKLPDLDELELQEGSYVDTKLVLCTHRFSSLKVLQVSGLPELEEIVVDYEKVMVMAYQHVKIETHKSCDDCQQEQAGPQDASSPPGPNQNKGNSGDGGSSHATTEEGANRSPLEDIEKKILAAVDKNGSSKTAIKDYIQKKYGDIVHQHLEHMVQSSKLRVTHGRYDKYYRPEAKPAEPQHASSSSAAPNKDVKLFEERILEAIDSDGSSKTAIKGYIKAKYGDIVQQHLNLMVSSNELLCGKVGGYNKYYRPRDGPQEQGQAGPQEQAD